jgi:hypothetical protein
MLAVFSSEDPENDPRSGWPQLLRGPPIGSPCSENRFLHIQLRGQSQVEVVSKGRQQVGECCTYTGMTPIQTVGARARAVAHAI